MNHNPTSNYAAGDPLASLSPEAWRVILRGRLKDLDRLERAYTAVEILVRPVDVDGGGEERNSLNDLPRTYLCALLQTLNTDLGEVLLEAHTAWERSAP